jgi:carbon monoxide dehydrogenase subunit G
MRVTGSHTLNAPRQQVWDALQNPEVLARTLPGCQQLEETAPDEYTVTVWAGIASIKGTYLGRVRLTDQDPPNAYTLKASGRGSPGTVDATTRVTLEDADGQGTRISYDADAIVGGSIGGVGQRVLSGVAKRTAGEFFTAIERELVEGPLAPAAVAPEAAPAGAPEGAPPEAVLAGAPEAAHPAAPRRVFRPPAPAAAPPIAADPKLLLAAAVAGALIALLGVLVGRRTAR